MSDFRYYLKKLTTNELGYRNGKLSTGQMFYISKQATCFFPPLSKTINNDFVILEFRVGYNEYPVFARLVYHNDKYNREEGTRDEYRIYLNRDLAPDDFWFRPDDIIVFDRIGEQTYILNRYRSTDSEYFRLHKIIEASNMRGLHALSDTLVSKLNQ